MIPGIHGWRRVVYDILLFIPLAPLVLVGYWWFENTVYKTTEVLNVRTDKDTYNAGDVVRVEYILRRYRTCKLELVRILERPTDRREFVVQLVQQLIEADRPVIDRQWGYNMQIPVELVTADYILYSRLRYFCNGLDYLWPRIYTTPSVLIHVIGITP